MRLRPLVTTLFVLTLGAAACTSAPEAASTAPQAPSTTLQSGSVLLGGAGAPVLVQVPSGSVLFEGDGAVASLGGRWLVGSSREDGGTVLETRDASTGEIVATEEVAGRLDPRIVSESGRAVALMDLLPAGWDPSIPLPRSSTRIVVADPTGAGDPRTYDLVGNFEPEAFSTDDGSLFLLQHLPAETPRAYRVTMLDLASGRVLPVRGPFKGPAERMPGIRLDQELSPDAAQLYTLYSSARPGYTPHLPNQHDGRIVAFVHVLSLRDGWAHCIGLPKAFWNRPASEQAMATSPDGRYLYVVDATLGEIAVMDADSLAVRSGQTDLRVQDIDRTSAVVSADGETLFVATSRGTTTLTAIDVATFDVLERWHLDAAVTGLGLSSDGEHLLAATADGLEIVDIATGEEVDALEVRTPAPATKVLAIGS
jgi:hypothetical protein